MTEQEYHDYLMRGPSTLYMIMAEFDDGTFKMYVFSTEEKQMDYVGNLATNATSLGIKNVHFHENLLNFTEEDSCLFIIH